MVCGSLDDNLESRFNVLDSVGYLSTDPVFRLDPAMNFIERILYNDTPAPGSVNLMCSWSGFDTLRSWLSRRKDSLHPLDINSIAVSLIQVSDYFFIFKHLS